MLGIVINVIGLFIKDIQDANLHPSLSAASIQRLQ